MRPYPIIAALFLLFCQPLMAQPTTDGWALISNENGMKVYTRPNSKSGIKEVRITTRMETSIPGLMTALADVPGYENWVYKCVNPKRLKTASEQEYYYYVESDLPFPASNRDLVVRSRQWRDAATGKVYSHSVGLPDYKPEVEDIVRIRAFESSWEITPNNDGTVYIDYTAKTDPGGNIPAWIINLGIATGPVKTMEKLAEVVQDPKYQQAEALAYLK
jgi:hypothetical protein